MRASPFALLAATAATLACTSSDPVSLPNAVRAAADAIDSTQLRADVTYLASDALLGRDTPSPGLDSAAAYVVRRLTALKLSPAGDSGTFLQHYVVRQSALDTVATFVEVGGRRFRFGTDFLVMNFADTGTTTGPMAYVGHGIVAPKRKIDAFAGVTTKGRVIIADGPGSMPRGESFATLGAIGSDWQPVQPNVAEGRAAALVFINTPRRLALWSLPGFHDGARQARGLWPSVPSVFANPSFPVLWVTPALGATLLASAPRGAASVMAKSGQGIFVPSFDLSAASQVTIRLALDRVTLLHPYNVVAMVEGSDSRLRGEAVVLGAHLDGAVGPARGRDTIYNAADDNASGGASLLAIAAAMMRAPRPRRSVIFVWDTGEEVGLWGSRFFATHPPVPLAQVVTYYNLDMIGRTKQPGTNVPGEEELAGPDEIFVAGPRALSTGLDSLLERTNRELLNIHVNHAYDRANHEYFYPRTDAEPLVTRGVLTLNYMNNEHGDYHMPSDESARLDLGKMTRVTKTIFAGAWMVASVRARPLIDKVLPATVKRYK